MPEKSLNEIPRDLRALYTRGADALQRDNFDYAIDLFTQILTKEPGLYEIRKALRTAQIKKAGDGGRGFFKKVFSGAGSSHLIGMGQLSLRKNPVEAIQIAEQIIAGDAYSGPGHKLLAEAAMAAEMPKTAVLSLEILAKNSPADKALSLQFAEALAASGDQTRAENLLAQLRRQHPNDNEVHMALKNVSARKTMDEGGYSGLEGGQGSYRDILKNKEEAVSLEQEKRQVKTEDVADRLIKEYEARLKTEPNNLKVLRDLGDLYAQKHQYDRALELFQKSISDASAADSAMDAKIAHVRLKKFDHELSQLDNTSPEYAEKMAQIKTERAAFQLEACRKRAEKYPTDLQIRFELGQLYLEAGKVSEAIQEFQKAINNPHRRIQSMGYLAQCFAKRGMNDMAAKRLQEALKEKVGFDDERKELLYNLGCIFEKMSKKEEAMEQFKQIYEVDIGYKDVAAKVDAFYSGGG